MRKTTITTTLTAVAAATLLLVLGTPAGATTGSVTSGTVLFHAAGGVATPTHTMAVPHTPDPCSTPLTTGQIDLVASGTATSGTWSATTPTPIESIVNIVFAGATRISFTFVTAEGTYDTAGAPAGSTHALASTGNHIVVRARLYDVNGSDCSTLVCTANARIVLDGNSGFDGTLPAIASGDTATFSGTSDTTGGNAWVGGGTCAVPYASILSRHVTALVDEAF